MGALGVDGGFWGWNWDSRRRRRKPLGSNASSGSTGRGGRGYQFPSKQAVTAGSLALTGDTIAQVTERWRKAKSFENDSKDILQTIFLHHDWFRALRMTSYGFLLYGPGSYAWYQFLDCHLPDQTLPNLLLKVLLNQIVLGPSVIAIVFAWNNLWQGKLSQLPQKYRKRCSTDIALWIQVLDTCQCVEFLGDSSSSKSSFHVNRVYLLEFLLVFDNEQGIVDMFLLLACLFRLYTSKNSLCR